MACPKCDQGSGEDDRFCQNCGHSLMADGAGSAQPEEEPPVTPDPPTEPSYAGFWRRFLAFLIDAFILATVSFLFTASFFLTVMSGPDSKALGVTVLSNRIFSFLLHWLYFTLMESSSKQATLGKMAIGIIVTDYNGQRISLLRANGRYFGKFLSAFIFGIGFIMAGFTRKKQALHDMLAETLVVMRRGGMT
ncbi:MAG TPA: RDD family protein [Geobacteraceae bacterium]|nr:RDD family protein [Geobacteraceae bacterium]